jgi:hypothetical protein
MAGVLGLRNYQYRGQQGELAGKQREQIVSQTYSK